MSGLLPWENARAWGKMKRLEAEVARLKAEVHRLEEIVGSDDIDRKYGMCCDASDEVSRLKAEVERLKKFNDEAMAHIAKEERKSRERLEIAEAEVERLTKAGDAMAEDLLNEFGRKEMLKDESYQNWLAAKEGKPRA